MTDYKFDPSLNILYKEHHNLDYVFDPKSIAVIGATDRDGSVGKTLLDNLLQKFTGKIYPVNPKKDKILGLKAYKSIKDIKDTIELCVIATPAKTVPSIIKEAVEAKIPAAVIISAGFKELGEPGIKLEKEIMKHAKGKMRIIGPNCLGVMNPINGLNATFAAEMANKGNIAFISQSGALCTAVLDWSLKEKVGFSSFVSIGSMLDVNWGDLIYYFGNDPNTKSILIYMESIGDPRYFLSAAREVALTKPIILIKAGRTKESAQAAASHTGALAGSDEVLNAALRRVGILRVYNISDLFNMAEVLSKQPIPKGPNLVIITNAGGPGVIATDALVESQGQIAKLSKKSYDELNNFLPEAWSHNNPVDLLGDATADLYAKSVDILSKDENVDGILVILTPQYMTDPKGVAEKLKKYSRLDSKPLLASWMGAKVVEDGMKILADEGIPSFNYPDNACKAFSYMHSYSYNLKGIYETPVQESKKLFDKKVIAKHKKVSDIIQKAKKENRFLLDEYESKKVLKAYDIPVVETNIAKNAEEAAELAEKIGFPIVLKLYSKTITHKTDVGGVKLNLTNKQEVKSAFLDIYNSVKKAANASDFQGVTVQPMIKLEGYELILGSSIDHEFGPVLLFGTGGQLVEIFQDKSLALPPLTSTLAKRMMEQTKIFKALQGTRGRETVNIEEMERILVRFSNLIVEYPEIKEFDINPLLASSDKIIALDARIILHKTDERPAQLAIRPYPLHYVTNWSLKDETEVIIRPIIPEDEPLVKKFYQDISEKSLKQRYLKVLHYDELIAHDRLVRICFNDYDKEIAIVTELDQKDSREILAIARLSKLAGTDDATFAILVKDKWQKRGIGKKLLSSLIDIAKEEGIEYLISSMFTDNVSMQKICRDLGFKIKKSQKSTVVIAELDLK